MGVRRTLVREPERGCTMWLLRMSSEYGEEEFEYSTEAEAKEGQARIEQKITALDDDIVRSFSIHESDDDDDDDDEVEG